MLDEKFDDQIRPHHGRAMQSRAPPPSHVSTVPLRIKLGQVRRVTQQQVVAITGQRRVAEQRPTILLLGQQFDDEEPWTRRKFVAAACHEFGHILGLEHTDVPDQLMNGTLHSSLSIREPQKDDIAALRRIWPTPLRSWP